MGLLAPAASKVAFSVVQQTTANALQGNICPPTARNAKAAAITAKSAQIIKHAPSARILSTSIIPEGASPVALPSISTRHTNSAAIAQRTAKRAGVMTSASPAKISLC